METIKISYNTKTKLVEEFEKKDYVQEVKKPNIFTKMGLGSKEYADIHFQTGILVSENMDKMKNAKKVIANTQTLKEQLVNANIDESKIEVIYPSVTMEYEKPSVVKKRVCEKLNIDENKKIVFFTAKNFINAGAKDFVELVAAMNYKQLHIIINGEKKQVDNLKFTIAKYDFEDRLTLLSDYENVDELFLAADVFILPTSSKAFATNVLKAMYARCVVFIPPNCLAKELVDVFGLMNSPTDKSIKFKIDALLGRDNDIEGIQKQNRKIAKMLTIEKNLEKLDNIVQSV